VYLNPSKPTISDVYESIHYRITAENSAREKQNLPPLKHPHRTTISRRISEIEAYQETLSRYGKKQPIEKTIFLGMSHLRQHVH
jgi:nitrate reductase beta subunit